MRRLRYSVAVSMDGFIAGPRDEYDWIIMDPSFDFEGLFKQFEQTESNGKKEIDCLLEDIAAE